MHLGQAGRRHRTGTRASNLPKAAVLANLSAVFAKSALRWIVPNDGRRPLSETGAASAFEVQRKHSSRHPGRHNAIEAVAVYEIAVRATFPGEFIFSALYGFVKVGAAVPLAFAINVTRHWI